MTYEIRKDVFSDGFKNDFVCEINENDTIVEFVEKYEKEIGKKYKTFDKLEEVLFVRDEALTTFVMRSGECGVDGEGHWFLLNNASIIFRILNNDEKIDYKFDGASFLKCNKFA